MKCDVCGEEVPERNVRVITLRDGMATITANVCLFCLLADRVIDITVPEDWRYEHG